MDIIWIESDVPPVIAEVFKKVDWQRVSADKVGRLSKKLQGHAFGTGLLDMALPQRVQSRSNRLQKRSDIPQAILNVINDVAWYELGPSHTQALAKKLETLAFGRFVNLPRKEHVHA